MKDLYTRLAEHREKIRAKEDRHTPTAVISDAALKNLARAKPTSLDDMLKVSGIGKAFVTKYGDGFLKIILEGVKPIKLKMMRKEAADTLKNLQARLTNVNKRNRMLYLPRTVSGRAIDLATGDINAAVDALFSFYGIGMSGEGEPRVICRADDEMYAQYNRLIHFASAGARETGNNNLYVGFPFAVGRCGKDAFNVVAPLVLFPVKLENVDGKILMKEDGSRSVSYNSALLLLNNKFNGKSSEPVPPCELDEVPKRDFISQTLAFYGGCGIKIDADKSGKTVKFPTYTANGFPVKEPNKYTLVRSAVVGLFPMYSGAMQKDFDNIIESGLMPPTLAELLKDADEVDDFYGASVDTVDGAIPTDSDGNIDYISELNVSQERAVEQAATQTTLVMQGPPGTGKSQTITSMISNEVCKGRNVLIVSQKRAALSVIYSRLGSIARYAMFIDDPKDKDAFYGKLKAMFQSADNPAPFNNVAYDRAVGSIDDDTAALDSIAKALTSDEYGVPMIDIYRENSDNPFKVAERGATADTDEAVIFAENVPLSLFDCGYDDIKTACEYLNDETLMNTLGEYYNLSETYDWLIDVKSGMSGADTAEAIGELDKLLDAYAYNRSLRGKLDFRKRLKAFVKAKFTAYDRKQYKRFVKDPVELYNGIKAYGAFTESKLTADSLDFCTRLYYGALYNIGKVVGKKPAELLKRLLDYCGYAYIDKFESEHRDVMSRITGFSTLVSRICSTIDKKRELTRDKTLNLLKAAFVADIADSKRKSDMLRAVEGKRRPAISKFVEKFEFELFRGVRVFLMTPEAVSEILPLKNDLFDLLVFDEASQIYVERGIPAIARARRLVVCGDRKQLRPSSLGDGRITVDDDSDDAEAEEESLLDIARFTFPEIMLGYHYRSRYEELIAFSNAAFYDGKLNISPNPVKPTAPPIVVHKVNGTWDERTNAAEAQKTVELVYSHLLDNAKRPESERETLGVITFNASQRDCILDLIDAKCDTDGQFRKLYLEECARRSDGEDVGLFVKNIENVQGDERDDIIFSFAYARNAKGKMSRNFGWLNRQGGENRLNVAISRAKKHIDIVTSIIPPDLKTDDIKSDGVKILRKYLDYAYCVSDGDTAGAKHVLDSFGNVDYSIDAGKKRDRLADSVYSALSERGIAADRNVGMGNYKLDIAVANSRGDYVLGIECDDSVLADDVSTRERDVMRGKFLRSRGWTLVRIWSSDWYANPDKVIKDITAKAADL